MVLIIIGGTYFFFNQQASDSFEDIVAEVNGEKISQSKVEETQQSFDAKGQQINKKQAVEYLIEMELLSQKAKSEGYSVSKEEAENKLKQQRSQQGQNIDSLKEQIEMHGRDYNEFIREQQKQFLIQKYLEKGLKKENFSVSEDEKKEFYENVYKKRALQQSNKAPSYNESEREIVKILLVQKHREVI